MIRHHQVDSWMARRLLFSWSLHLVFSRRRFCRWFRDISARRWVLQLSRGCMFEPFTERWVVGFDPYFAHERLWYKLDAYRRKHLAIKGRFGCHVLISIAQSWDGMAMHCLVGWLFAKEKRQNGASLIDVADDGGENDCGARCGNWCHIDIEVGGDWEEDVFLQDDLVDKNEFKLILLALLPASYASYSCNEVDRCCTTHVEILSTKSPGAPLHIL